MPHYNPDGDVYASNTHFLSASVSSPGLKPPSRHNLSARRSTASLRSASLAHSLDDDSSNGRHHSLAHELAVALMPEPSAGSKLLAEEFGIEFDEGAEGIDEVSDQHAQLNGEHVLVDDSDVPSFASELVTSTGEGLFHDLPPDIQVGEIDESPQEHDYDPVFHNPTFARKKILEKKPEQDAMEILAQDLESTDKFLNHLRTIDAEAGSSSQPVLERLASDVIRRMNLSVRDREGHVRELLEYEREFRKIAGEVGGGDILGQLDELEHIEDLSDTPTRTIAEPSRHEARILEVLDEEPRSPTVPHHLHASDWELDPDRHLGDEDEVSEPPTSPLKDSFLPPPVIVGPATPASTIPQLNHLRSFTTSLVSSLSTISEQAQVNGAATAEAGRKIRALKNKMGGWRTEWDSAERSRIKIERWEAGIIDGETPDPNSTPISPTRAASKRIDGRSIVEEHLRAFEMALADAALKTQAIMAR
ncbi:hypothetical protein BDN70DRAFT_877541 [Pholiota conissans]|uniref:Uncharacterized protein n=1 Tax=Pholiota conissans TaxID=109636 RepID=A0A9P6CUH2_9AGAR|nr:hypothetical protein BDN70DRAFT_877541 [Pholiota conissans]